MKIYIVRHGETLANKSGLLQGWSDTSLSELGISLAKITGEGLKDIHFDVCYSSPLKRASDTAKIILSKNKYEDTKIIYDERIKEINMGDWEMKHFKGPDSPLDEKDVKKFFSNPFLLPPFPNGEGTNDVVNRCHDFLLDLVKNHHYKNVLITTHGFALRALLNFMYEDKLDFWQGRVPYNCAVNIIEYKDHEFRFIEKDKIYYDKDKIHDRYKV